MAGFAKGDPVSGCCRAVEPARTRALRVGGKDGGQGRFEDIVEDGEDGEFGSSTQVARLRRRVTADARRIA